jgi:Flp pilus assembly pilin Flp
MLRTIKRFWADQSGNSAIEYGLLVAILGMGLVFSLSNLQASFTEFFSSFDAYIPD